MQASPRPPGPMTAATAQRLADYNKKQSFPLSSHLPAPLRLPPPFPCYAKRAGTGVPTPGTKPAPASRARFSKAAPLRSQACPRIRGLLQASTASPASRCPAVGIPQKKPQLWSQTLYLQQAWGGEKGEKGGGRTRLAQTFSVTASPSSTLPQVSKTPAYSPSPSPGTPEHPLLSRACRQWGSGAHPEPGTPPRLPFPLHQGTRAGAARRRGTQAPPDSPSSPILPCFPPGGSAG